MDATFDAVFDKLVEDGYVDVAITGVAAENLRTSLVKRWNRYKEQYDSLGFLPEEKKALAVSKTGIEKDGIICTRYLLRPKTRSNTYQIL
jgi:hypothetical protein